MSEEASAPILVTLLREAQRAVAAAADAVDAFSSLAPAALLESAELAGDLQRLTDAVMVRTVDAVEAHCRQSEPEESLAARYGLRDGASLLMVLTRASRRTLTKYRQLAGVTGPRGVGSTGVLPPLMPHLAQALRAGTIGLDQGLVIRQAIHQAAERAHPEDLDAAERALVASAVGAPEPDGTPRAPLAPDLLAVQARAWREAIDPDGPEPTYEQQRAQRSFTFGQRADGMWSGTLLLPPDQGAAVRLALDAHNAPRTKERHHAEPGADERTTPQRQADTIVGLVARAMEESDAPRIGGEAATLVVTITPDQLRAHAESGRGTAHLEHTGDAVPAHVAARMICDGHVQVCLLDEAGLPLRLGRARRTHTVHQRRAIFAAYPGGCQNPSCHAPPGFTEIHHPVWWSRGGGTDTENGIPLCQHCHIEVHAGRLECVRGPSGRWRVVPTARLRSRFRLAV